MKKKIYLSTGISLINKKYKKNEHYHYIQEPNNIIIIPIIKRNKFILVFQKREPINRRNYEFPMGWVDKGESPIESARRELLEETGYKSLIKLKKLLFFYPDPGRINKKMICYYTDRLMKLSKPEKGIKIIYCSKKKIFDLIKKNKFNNASHIAAYYHYLLKKN
jgi:ADP-ribose pyrophosphatase|tara:strand:+ start:205 stop:696 length:492 start_codon:yes stop_codon:yes gene_type:complete